MTGEPERRLDELQRLVALAFEADRAAEHPLATVATFVRWRSDDADIAFFVEEAAQAVPVRDVDAPRPRTLKSKRGHEIGLTITEDTLVGTIRPWSGGDGSIEFIDGRSTPIEVDEHGSFYAERPPAASIRLHFADASGDTPTEWFLL